MKRRILLMYISKVSGHRSAIVAVEKSLKRLMPSADIMSINGFGYNYPILEGIINVAYMGVIRHTPRVWDYLYDNPRIVKRSANLRKSINQSSHKKFAKLLASFPADTVVCSQAFPCGMIADYKMAHKLPIRVVGVLTDWAPHSYWINDGVDVYVVPSEDTRERFIKKGVPADKIRVFGIPVRCDFAERLDKKKVRKDLGLAQDIPAVLVMGGGQGLGKMREAVQSLLASEISLQLIVIAGANKKLYKWLKKATPKADKKVLAYDRVENVDVLMEAADLIVTKPGGMTTSECLTKGLPMVIINPLPGQEARNTDFLIEHGIAVHVHDISDLSGEVELLLKSPEKLAQMSRAAQAQGKPHAADDIARLIKGLG